MIGEIILMNNTKILEMINNGQIEELKKLVQDEIFSDSLKSSPGAKQRYAAMKKYFSYVDYVVKAYKMPCAIDFEGEKHISFCNGYSIVLTKEPAGEIELFGNPSSYPQVGKSIVYDGEPEEIDFNRILTEAKSQGYKLKKTEIKAGDRFRYLLRYDRAYYKIGLLDAAYSIINDGSKATAWHKIGIETAPLVIKNSIGICVILPVNNIVEKNKIIISMEQG